MELFDDMLTRKSVRSYTDQQISEEQLQKILIAASLAPVGKGKSGRPHLTIVQDPQLLKELGGQAGPERNVIYGAPTLIIVSHPKVEDAPGIAAMNVACVMENMTLAATDLGLGSIYLYGSMRMLSRNPELMQRLGIPEGNEPLSALGVGYGTEAPAVCKEMKKVLTENRV